MTEKSKTVEEMTHDALAPFKEELKGFMKSSREDYASAFVKSHQDEVANRSAERTTEDLVKAISCVASANQPWQAPEIAKMKGYSDVAKDLSPLSVSGGAALIAPNYSNAVIELLRNESVFFQCNPQRVELINGHLVVPRHASGSMGGWGGACAPAPESEPSFDMIQMQQKKAHLIVPVCEDLLNLSSFGVQSILQADMFDGLATLVDQAFIYGTGASGQPLGLLGKAPVENFVSGAKAGASITLDEIRKFMSQLRLKLKKSNVRPTRESGKILMSYEVEEALKQVSDGNGNLAFPEMSENTLQGYSYVSSNNVPSDKLIMVDFKHVLYGAGTPLMKLERLAKTRACPTHVDFYAETNVDIGFRHDGKEIAVLENIDWIA